MKKTILLLLICALAHHVLTAQSFTKEQALDFLYTYMPQSDRADYDRAFFKMQVDYAFLARETFSWGKTIPDDIFKHFVLVYRVNNEDLDTARAFIFHQLRDRIKDMSMYDAALEVNHWCHEHVDYQPADVRTSAPLATIRTSHGRCGEESTLTVTALRAVGIPARQCYTPRWAHCDDNHAWVEVWVDGKWWFLGACEPDPDLNMGWFAYPSTRTMMVHTNVFGDYHGPEEVNKKTPYYSCINVLSNYADTVHLTVTVVDEQHKPIKEALVRFKLYNYAEYYTLAAKLTDENGQASLVTGKGDLLVWVSKGDLYNFYKVDGRVENERTIVFTPREKPWEKLELSEDLEDIVDLTIVPPMGNPDLPTPDPVRQARCDQRKQYEDSLREAYRATFPTPASLTSMGFHNENFTDEELYDVIRRSEGNHAEIMAFLNKHPQKEPGLYLKEFVAALADKDLRDTKAETLESQLTYYHVGDYPLDVFLKGILPARISNELIRDWQGVLSHGFGLVWRDHSVKTIYEFVKKSIVVDPDCNYYNCPISPAGVIHLGRSDAHSRDIFFVALCRAFNVPAYMDNSNGDIFAWENGKWNLVTFEEKPTEEYKTLILFNPNRMGYYTQYTLQRFENGEFVSFDFENDPRVETDPIVLSVPAGYYCLSLGERQPDGSVLSQMQFFDVTKDTTMRSTGFLEEIQDPYESPEDAYLGVVNMEKVKVGNKTLAEILDKAGKEHIILCLGTPGTEPVNHLTKEIATKKDGYETWHGPMFFVMKEGQWKSEPGEPRNLRIITEGYDELVEIFSKALNGKLAGLNPMCFVIDQKGNIIFFSEGYDIGVGYLMLRYVLKNSSCSH
ncbi:MAG: transglutaminase domain-containing protein [Bacteroidales bacterium]|nr:transglutaminase domain-containing protein [Bacteroidales bacterium]